MKRRWILPACLILVGLIVVVLACIHGFGCLSESESSQIAFNYVKVENTTVRDNDIQIREIVLTSDLITLVAGTQQWIVLVVGPDDQWSWLYMNAYTGKVDKAEYGFKEWVVPTDVPPVSRYTSLVPAIPYVFMIWFSFRFFEKQQYKTKFWLSTVSFVISPLLITAIVCFFHIA